MTIQSKPEPATTSALYALASETQSPICWRPAAMARLKLLVGRSMEPRSLTVRRGAEQHVEEFAPARELAQGGARELLQARSAPGLQRLQDLDGSEHALPRRRLPAHHARAVARDRDALQRRGAVRVDHGDPAEGRIVPAVLDSGRLRQRDVGNHALMQQERVHGQRAALAAGVAI